MATDIEIIVEVENNIVEVTYIITAESIIIDGILIHEKKPIADIMFIKESLEKEEK